MGGADSPKFYLLTIVIVFPFREKRISPSETKYPKQYLYYHTFLILAVNIIFLASALAKKSNQNYTIEPIHP